MDLDRDAARALIALLSLLALSAGDSGAQLIPLRSVPVASGDQFLLFPSERLGMGGVSIALDDTLGDSFVNPAKGSRVQESLLFTSPTYYAVTDDNGSGRSLPMGVLLASDHWFGSLAVSLQQLRTGDRDEWWAVPQPVWLQPPGWAAGQPLRDKSANNHYAFVSLGRTVGGGALSVAGSVFWAGLDALDGVEHLYAGSVGLQQDGNIADFRVGMVGSWEGERSLEVLLLHNRIDMTHEVRYLDWFWGPDDPMPMQTFRVDKNEDRTRTWGVHAGYVQPLSSTDWKLGGLFTVNRKSHPKIPNYEIQNIPRDPGDTWAYNFGLGLGRTYESASVGIDLVLEPIWSETWQEAEGWTPAFGGKIIPPGGKTIENEFSFLNFVTRIGVEKDAGPAGFQLGVAAHSIDYELRQFDNVAGTRRDQEEGWVEWTFTWGANADLREFGLRYLGRVTTGTGRPGVSWAPPAWADAGDMATGDFILAPSGPLTLQDASVHTHQISVVIPLR